MFVFDSGSIPATRSSGIPPLCILVSFVLGGGIHLSPATPWKNQLSYLVGFPTGALVYKDLPKWIEIPRKVLIGHWTAS